MKLPIVPLPQHSLKFEKLNLQFQHIDYLWGLALIPVFILLFIQLLAWKRKVRKRIGDPDLVANLISGYAPKLFLLRFVLFVIAFGLGVLAIANLRQPGSGENIARKGIDVVIALDLSKSMLASDIQPSRLDRAREFIRRLETELENDRIALVFFAGRAYLQMPLTADHNAALMFVSTADPADIAAQGTALKEALEVSATAFNTMEGRFKTVVLITDGEDHEADALEEAGRLAEMGIVVHTVGIGSEQGAGFVDPETGAMKKDAGGNAVISKMNPLILRQISDKTNGIYLSLHDTGDAVAAIMSELSQIDKKSFGDTSLMEYKTYYGWFAGAMLVLLLLESVIPERKKKGI